MVPLQHPNEYNLLLGWIPSDVSAIKRNNVKVLGRGTRPIMFSHGFGCDQNMWRFVVPAFENDYKVVLFDHVGAGNSDLTAFDRGKYQTLEGYAQDVLEICNELDLTDVSFVGHSVSSMIGILAAIQQPARFANLVLVGPSPRYINDESYVGGFERHEIDGLLDMLDVNYLGWASTMAPVIMGNSDRPELAEELQSSFCRTDPQIAKFFARVTFLSDNREDLNKVQTRTLVLQCSEDIIAPLSVGEFVHHAISDSKLVIMRATGHCPNLSAPGETTAAIHEFLRRCSDIANVPAA
jgi:sigma-B regulation protein RsbQ